METTNYKCSLKRWKTAAKTLKEKIWSGLATYKKHCLLKSFCQLPLALACKFISEQTSCTHLLSAASVIHSKRIIVSGIQHM